MDGWRGRESPKKRWMDCAKNDMKEKGVNDSMTIDRMAWNKKTCSADPKSHKIKAARFEDDMIFKKKMLKPKLFTGLLLVENNPFVSQHFPC